MNWPEVYPLITNYYHFDKQVGILLVFDLFDS